MVQTIELSSLGVGGGEEVAAQESSELRGDASNCEYSHLPLYSYDDNNE